MPRATRQGRHSTHQTASHQTASRTRRRVPHPARLRAHGTTPDLPSSGRRAAACRRGFYVRRAWPPALPAPGAIVSRRTFYVRRAWPPAPCRLPARSRRVVPSTCGEPGRRPPAGSGAMPVPRRLPAQEREQFGLLLRRGTLAVADTRGRTGKRSPEERLGDCRVNVAATGDRRGVPELLSGLADRLGDGTPIRRVVLSGLRAPQGPEGRQGTRPCADVLGGDIRARCLAKVGVDVLRAHGPSRPVCLDVLEESWPGSSWQRATTRARRLSRTVTSCRLPPLPRNVNRREAPSTCACRSRSVVSPNDRFRRAYSSLPTRMRVSSISRTTSARTLRRGRPRAARSASTVALIRGRRAAKATIRSYLARSRRVR